LNKTIVLLVSILLLGLFMVPLAPETHAQDFSVTVSPGTQTHIYNANVTYYIEVQSISGFTASVFLYASISPSKTGISVGPPDPGLVTPPKNGVAHSILQIRIGNDPSYVGSYTITVTASSGGLTRYGYSFLTVTTTGDVSMYTTPRSQLITPGGAPTYSLGILWAGASPSPSTFYVNLPMSGASAAFYGTYGSGTPTYGPFTPSQTTPDNPTLTITTLTSVAPGSYPISVVASGATTRNYYFILVIRAPGDFSISASPTSLSINQGDTASSDITVTSTSPFSSPTSLSWSWLDTAPTTGVTPSLSPTTVTPTSGGSKKSKLTITTTSTATKGTFTIMVTGTCYQLSDNVNITLAITSAADFSMTASPTPLSIVAGQIGTSTITITSTGGFDSAVSLSFSWVGTSPTGVTPSLSAYSVTPSAGGTATSTLTIATSSTTAAGSYVVRITGVSGTLTHSVDVTFTVTTPPLTPDFTISVSPSSATIRRGQSGNFVVIIASTGGFASPATLALSGQPTDVTGTFNPVSVTPPSGGSATSTLTVSVGATAPLGTYTLTVTGTGGTLSHQATIALTVETVAGVPPVCIIATATYGSELSPEVQFLRGFRDGMVMSTFAGSEFMVAFNAWYYSFSPYIAQFIANNAFARAAMKVLLYPLIGILHLAAMTYNALSFSHELAVIMAGLVASALIGVVYFSPLAILALVLLRRYRKTTLRISQLRMLAIVWVASLFMILVGEVAPLPVLVMASTALFVLSTLVLGALAAATAILRRIR